MATGYDDVTRQLGSVLHASDRWYESWHVGDPSVVLVEGRYYMAYSATSEHFSPGQVSSHDGAVRDGCRVGRWHPLTKTDRPLLIRGETPPIRSLSQAG